MIRAENTGRPVALEKDIRGVGERKQAGLGRQGRRISVYKDSRGM